jgi:hypothetical protein
VFKPKEGFDQGGGAKHISRQPLTRVLETEEVFEPKEGFDQGGLNIFQDNL